MFKRTIFCILFLILTSCKEDKKADQYPLRDQTKVDPTKTERGVSAPEAASGPTFKPYGNLQMSPLEVQKQPPEAPIQSIFNTWKSEDETLHVSFRQNETLKITEFFYNCVVQNNNVKDLILITGIAHINEAGKNIIFDLSKNHLILKTNLSINDTNCRSFIEGNVPYTLQKDKLTLKNVTFNKS